jgi:hypothetical protein
LNFQIHADLIPPNQKSQYNANIQGTVGNIILVISKYYLQFSYTDC